MLLFVGAGSKQSMENRCMRRCDCNLSLIILKVVLNKIIQLAIAEHFKIFKNKCNFNLQLVLCYNYYIRTA